MSENDEFYAELDQKTEKKSFCTCQTMAIFLGTLLIALVALTIYLALSLKNHNVSFEGLMPILKNKITADQNIESKAPSAEIVITDEDLNATLGNLKSYSIKIEEPQFLINSADIELDCKLVTLFKLPAQFKILPQVSENKIKMNVVKAKVSLISAPKMIQAGLENSIDKIMDENLQEFYKSYKITDIQLEEGKMTIFGKIK